MIAFVVSPSWETSAIRVSSDGRRPRLNEAVPVACRWLISSATARLTRTMYELGRALDDRHVLVRDLGRLVGGVAALRAEVVRHRDRSRDEDVDDVAGLDQAADRPVVRHRERHGAPGFRVGTDGLARLEDGDAVGRRAGGEHVGVDGLAREDRDGRHEPDHLGGIREHALGVGPVRRDLAQDDVGLDDGNAGRDRHRGDHDRHDGDARGLGLLASLVQDEERQSAGDQRDDDARDDDHLAATTRRILVLEFHAWITFR